MTTCLFSCSKDIDNNDSVTFCQAVLDDDQDAMFNLLEEITAELSPIPTANDPLGHEANYNALIDQLNDLSCLTASGHCYACIRTLPAQSTILVSVELDGAKIEEVLSISTPKDEPLLYLKRQ